MSENIPAASITTRLNPFQSVQVPPNASASLYPNPTMYPMTGLLRPPLSTFPNATSLVPTSFSAGTHGGGGPSIGPGYEDQRTTFPPKNVNPSIFPMDNARFQESLYPFVSMLPGNPTTDLLLSEGGGHHEQPLPLPFPWPLSMQTPAAAIRQQAQYQIPQGIAEMGPPREPGSIYRGDRQINVVFHAGSSLPEMYPQLDRGEKRPYFQFPADNTISRGGREADKVRLTVWHTFRDLILQPQQGADEFYCEPCDRWFPVHKKRKHDKKHEGEYVCRICEILGKPCRP